MAEEKEEYNSDTEKEISNYDLKLIAEYIASSIRDDFEVVHLSRNLADTLKVINDGNKFKVDIKADRYNVAEYRRSGTIVYNHQGSYAQKVNVSGGYSKKHIGYVEESILRGITRYVNSTGKEGAVITLKWL